MANVKYYEGDIIQLTHYKYVEIKDIIPSTPDSPKKIRYLKIKKKDNKTVVLDKIIKYESFLKLMQKYKKKQAKKT